MSKTKQILSVKWLLVALLSFTGFCGYSQTTAVFIEVKNMVQTSPSEFQYEVWCTNTGTTALAIRGYSWGLNTAIGLNQSAYLTQSFISRDAIFTGSAVPAVNPVPSASVTATPAFPSATSATHFRGTTVNDPGTGVAITAGVPIRLATMRINRVTAANGTVANPWTGNNINPFINLGGTLTPIQVVTASGKTQCVVTMTVTPPGSSFAINGTANSAVAGTLQALTATMTPSPTGATPFLLNPSCTTPITATPQNATACSSYTWTDNNATYTASGTYTFTVSPGAPLCDTIKTLNLTIVNPVNTTTTVSNCGPYTWTAGSGSTYTTTGVYTFTTQSGPCVNTSTLNLTVTNPVNTTVNVTNCGPYTWTVASGGNGNTYTASGTYTFTTQNGPCVNSSTLNLTVVNPVNTSTTVSNCGPYTWSAGSGLTYTASGTYTFTSQNGPCVNTSTLDLTLTNPVNTTTNVSNCGPYTWTAGSGLTYTTSGVYTFTTQNGPCVNTATLTLTVNSATSSTTTASASSSYTWAANNVTYTASGTYTATLINSVNCDSIATLNLTITGAPFTLNLQEDQPISCNGANDGSIQATAVSTGTFTYTYSIDGGPFNNSLGFFPNVSAGTHTVCATNGTSTVCDTITLVQPAPLTLLFSVDDTVTCAGNDGQVSVTINGGTNILQPYQTTWTDASSNVLNLANNYATALTGLSVGTYFLLVEDDNGCMATGSVALPAYPALVLTATKTPIACAGGTSVISASATGGKGNKVITVNGSPLAASYAAGTYTVVATDVAGCTSATVLTITQPAALASTTTASACNSYLWSTNNTTYTSSGTFTVTLQGANNCDSVATLVLTIKNASVNAPSTVSACVSYTWPVNGVTYTTSGVKTATFTNQAGCDSSFTLNLTINQNTTVTTTVIATNTYTWSVNGVTYTNSGIYTATSTNANGCVQTNVLNLTINVVAFTINVITDQNVSCAGNNDGSIITAVTGTGPFTFILDGGVAINATGTFTNLAPGIHTVCAIVGLSIACDTALVTSPAPLAATFNTVSMESCLGGDGILEINITGGTNALQGYLTWWYAGPVAINWPQPGYTLNDLLTNNFALMMDSLSAGPYTVVVEDDNGCFQTFTGSLQHAPAVSLTANIPPIICYGGTTTITPVATGGYPGSPITYTINGLPVAASYGPGTYTIVATDTTTCSSSLVVTITAPTAPITSSVSLTKCDAYTWPASGLTYTTSGVYTKTLVAANSCDSVVTLNLTINYSTSGASSATACNSYTWTGATYTASGAYVKTFTNAANCDSVHTLNLTINYSNTGSSSAMACNTYTWTGTTYTTSGAYVKTFTNAANCDSVHTLNLTINYSNTGSSSLTACNAYTWTGTTYTTSGTYVKTFTNAANCDSVHTLNLTINFSSTGSSSATACNTYTWTGTTYTASGAYVKTFTNAANCDSVHTLNLTINYSNTGSSAATACNTYTWTGTTYTASGAYVKTFTNAANCDSVHTLNLTINYSNTGSSSLTACNAYTWTGTTYTTSGTYVKTFTNAANCDSVHTLNLTINYSNTGSSSATACDSYTWTGTTYTTSGTYVQTFTNAANCDSVHTLNLTVNYSSTNGGLTTTQCNSYTWNGTTYTTSGIYSFTSFNASGCVNTATLNLTIINSTSVTTNATACASYTWSANAMTYTASGTYTATFIAVNTCDSIAILNLTVNQNPNVTASGTTTACNNSVITLTGGGAITYSWNPSVPNGLPFVIASTTTYTVTGTAANGCTATSTITVNTTGGSADIVNTTAGNATSIAGSASQTQNQIDGSTIAYRDVNCKMIATIQDPVGGNVFGNVNASAIVYATVPVYNAQPYFARFYTISGSAGPATLTLYLTHDDFNDYNANAGTYPQIPVPANPANGDTAHLCISQVPQTVLPGAPGAQTTVHQVTAVWNAAFTRWEVTFTVNGFGGFYFHACTGVALSASVTNFTGHKEPSKDILEWTTRNEQNNAYFNLEYSKDGVNFTKIAKVFTKAPGGTSSIDLNYASENLKPVSGHNYYRLQQVDIDGHGYYVSNIIDLIREVSENSVSVYPNPFAQQINIDLYTTSTTDARVKIMDMSGRIVKQILTRTTEGMNSLTISTSELAAGMYTLQIFEDNQLTHVEKVRKDN